MMSVRSIRSLSFGSSVIPPNLVGPAVRLILYDYGIDPVGINGSGPKGNILKSDVLTYIASNNLKKKPVDVKLPALHPPKPISKTVKEVTGLASQKRLRRREHEDIPLSNMRSVIARRLSDAKSSIPHNYTSVNVPSEQLTSLRKKLSKKGIKVSVNDFIIKAAALALRSVPQVNVQWHNDLVMRVPEVDISVAVATPSGLITPIVFRADTLKVDDISTIVRELAVRARENKLKPTEFQGGSFTISNLGMFGIHTFTAIINPPQTAILAVGGVKAGVDEDFQLLETFSLTLCYDNRAIGEVDAHRFLAQVKLLLSQPELHFAADFDRGGHHDTELLMHH